MRAGPLPAPGAPTTFVEVLRRHAGRRGDRTACVFLADGEAEAARLTYGELDRRCRAVAAELQRRRGAGERALLLFPPGLDFVTAFLGCLYAGTVAVPAYPPASRRHRPRLRSIAADARPRLALTASAAGRKIRRLADDLAELDGVDWLATDAVAGDLAAEWRDPGNQGSTLAFLQYTSGSTAEPKGVEVLHGNLLHNQELIRRAFELDERAVIVGWLPLYHDMGLIGNLLHALYLGASTVLMSPVAFLQKPVRWLDAISRYRATTSGGPNFAYDLCARKVPAAERAGLDLSSWTVAFTGAEPVRAETLDRFAESFAECGFERRAFFPCYGLAETTLMVSGSGPRLAPVVETVSAPALERHRIARPAAGEAGRRLVGCGAPGRGLEVRIVDPDARRPCEPGEVGEVWVRGGSVARGYWNRPEASARDFRARVAEEDPDRAYLRTGDLGFRRGDELFVCGRLKDLIILRGRNHYPQDLEATAEQSHPALRPGCGAAVAAEVGGEERLVIVHELERRPGSGGAADDAPETVAARVRQAVAEAHEVQVYEVVLVRAATIPKTSSGKIRRRACLAAWRNGGLAVVARSTLDARDAAGAPDAEPDLERGVLRALEPEARGPRLLSFLSGLAARSLDGPIADPAVPLTRLGLDSLAAVELQQAVEGSLGVTLPPGEILEGASLEDLAAEVLRRLDGTVDAPATEGGDRAPGPWPEAGAGDVGERPLTEGEKALWLLHRLDPGGSAYNLAGAARIQGTCDVDALRRAFGTLVRRHPALRTTFGLRAGEPVARVAAEPRFDFRVEGVEAAGLAERLDEAAWRPFDLAGGPLLRVAVFRPSGREQVLLLAVHHAVADFWSLAVLVRELGALYGAETGGPPAGLEPLPVSLGDVARRQRELLASPVGRRLETSWRRRLLGDLPAGEPPALDLPADRPRPPSPSFRGAGRCRLLEPGPGAGLLTLARRRGTTPYVLLLAAFQALLHRLTGQPEVWLGTPRMVRSGGELRGLVGYLVNPVVSRSMARDSETFAGYLDRVRASVREAGDDQEAPFGWLVERLRLSQDASRSPLFQAMFVWHGGRGSAERAGLAGFALGLPGARLNLGGLELASLPLERRSAQFDLTLAMAETGDGRLAARLDYASDLYDGTTAERLLRRLEVFLGGVAADPGRRIAELPVLDRRERHQLLVEWNGTPAGAPDPGATLIDLFAAQAERTPDRPALRHRGRVVTYRGLAARAAGLARRLGEIDDESRVGVCLDRGPDMVAALLAVLAAGGAYVPLDPGYPRERLELLAGDAGTRTILTQGRHRALFADLEGRGAVELVRVDRDPPPATGDLPVRARPGGLAYLIYTSGSTGRPKGVAIEHRSAAALAGWARELFPPEELEGSLAATSINFDLSVFEIFVPLCLGGTVILARDALELPDLLERDRVRLVNTVPSAIAELARGSGVPGGVSTVNLAGEPLRRALADAVHRLPGVRRVLNLYGPSEDTTYSTVAAVPRRGPGEPAIGRPVTGTRAYVLDRRGRPAAPGTAGELHLGGRGLARGYLGRPGLTAERFVPDGPGGARGARLYRTGDRARSLADGELAFLGRFDHQVKLRGFRIELGEIEAALLALEAVREAAVLVREERPGDPRLVAYLTPAGEPAEPSALRAELGRVLPDAMVPAAFVVLDELPLLPNGKVDRRALREVRPEVATGSGAPPRSRVERAIAAAWRRVLGVGEVGVQDNFFELGGHSLLLVRVHGELRRTLSEDLDLTELFRYPTIASLAAHLGARAGTPETPAGRVEAAAGRAEKRRQRRRVDGGVAILAMAGRFPGAGDVDELWRNLRGGVESIVTFSDEELLAAGVDPADLAHPDYVKAAGAVAGADLFDASFFGLAPREAERLDPQQRLFLECAWEVLEKAGYGDAGGRGAVGVFAGASFSTYLFRLAAGGEPSSSMAAFQALVSNDKDFLATRVAYKLDLHGPALSVQTACSTSLVAVHQACLSLQAGECDLAIAGGVSVRAPLEAGYFYQPDGIFSPDGHCRAFAAGARGTVPGSGTGVVLLKPLADALEDGDGIVAVVRGSAINNDGAVKVGYTAPSLEGQAAVVSEAWQVAGLDPATAGYVEAHGTGTPLGDPIEVAALNQVFGPEGRRALGSVKTNLGHLDAAAGIAGLIKAALAVRHGEIPPSLHCREPHPEVDFAAGAFAVATELRDWPGNGTGAPPRRAGVSSFGIGGTNCHVVLEEAPAPDPPAEDRCGSPELLVLSARSEAALDEAATKLGKHLERHPELDLADVAHTLRVGRKAFEHRRLAVCREPGEAAALLGGPAAARDRGRASDTASASLAFLFPGQSSPASGAGGELYRTEPVFRREIDRSAEILAGLLGMDLRPALFGAAERPEEARRRWLDTAFAQPALVALEVALARLWTERVGAPAALLGHSLGEYAAACLAGVFSLEDTLAVVAERGRLMAGLPAGAMLAVPLSEADLADRLDSGLALAAVNAPDRSVVSGPVEAIAGLEERLASEGVRGRRLATRHAFHSAMTEPILEPFRQVIEGVARRPPEIPYLSNVTGGWITAGEATSADYWVRHLRHPVRFADGAGYLLEDPGAVLVEMGPGRDLTSLARRVRPGSPPPAVAALPDRRREGSSAAENWLRAVGRVWVAGYPVDWRAFGRDAARRRRVELPTYPFERRRYWLEPAPRGASLPAAEPAPVGEAAYHPRPELAGDYAEPHTALERRLAEVWREVLGIEQIGRHDDFFELGGDSLQATQVASRLQAPPPARRRPYRETAGLTVEEIFRHPTLAELAVCLEAKLAEAAGAAAASRVALPPLEARERDGGTSFPTSFAQERLWFLDQLEPGRATYNVAVAVRVRGRLDVAALDGALGRVVRRHEALRTTFGEVEGRPVQVVGESGWDSLPVVDLGRLPGGARQGLAGKLLRDEVRRPFDLAAGPLLRTLLVRDSGRRHTAVLTLHHVVADGWSMGVLLRELGAFYGAAVEGRPARLPALAVQYPDVTRWQRRAFQGEVLERSLAFWRERLAGLPVLEVPADRPRPAQPRQLGARLPVGLASAGPRRLTELGRRHGATPFMTLLATFAALLGRVSGQTDLAVGSPDANRDRLEVEGLIGFFVNTLVLRVDLGGDPTFVELLARVRDEALAAEAHRGLPFEKLVQEISPERHLARTPLFQVMLVFQNAPLGPIALPGLELEPLPVDTGTAKFDLTLELEERGGRLGGALEYDRELFDASTVERLWRRFETLANAWTSDPERRLSEVRISTPGERHQALFEWSGTGRRSAPPSPTLVGLFEDRAARSPEALALEDGGACLSYRELDARANRLAHHLRRRGVRPGGRVGLFVERSLDLWIGLLGILKAGAAYVPLDAAYPAERRRFMLADSGAAVLVTRVRLLDGGAGGPAAVCLDRDREAIAGESGETPAVALHGGNLAYVIYTSGSTGRPKGVALPHRALAQLIAWQERTTPGSAGLRTLQFSPVSFDASCQEAFSTWHHGGTLVLVSEDDRRDPGRLGKLVARRRVDRLYMPFVALHQLADAVASGWVEVPAGLRDLITAGEQLRITPEVATLFRALPRGRLYNHYGPSETHVVTWYPLADGDPASWPSLPPIGRPVDGTTIRLLDGGLRPVAPGVAGELYAGGVALAWGYLDRPGLSAERFLPDPWGAAPGERLYRTGDLARHLGDGNVEFLGRADQQVKVRGYRVEPGEVEAALGEHPRVRQAAVTVDDRGGSGQARLVAYLAVREGSPATVSELRRDLGGTLPEYMVPAVFVVLDELPLTPSGKVDRRALPAPPAGGDGDLSRPPRTPAEELVAGVWAEVLGVERVGADDDFFELGGHSLLATQVISRLRRIFPVDLALRELFLAPTVATLADRLSAAGERSPEGPPLARRASGGAIPLSSAQERLWFLDRLDPGGAVYNLPAAVEIEGDLDVAAFGAAVTALTARHEVLRTTFPEVEGRPVQRIAERRRTALPVVDLSGLAGDRCAAVADDLARREARQPFDLARGPLLRLALLRLEGGRHRALVVLHHIVSDGWSIGVMLEELEALYAAARAGEAPPLPELPVQYADYAVWQRRRLRGEALEERLAYWRRRLAGLPALELPADRPRSAISTHRRGATLAVALPAELSRRLAELGRRRGATLFMTLFAGFATLLRHTTGQRDVGSGFPVANRDRVETEGLVGFFVNTLVLRADLAGDPTFGELLGRVRILALEADEHRDVPFETVVAELDPRRHLSATPLVQVVFGLQNLPRARRDREPSALRLTPLPIANGTAKFDLTLLLEDRPLEDGRGLAGSLEYDRDLFDETTVERLWRRFAILLDAAAADPEKRVGELPRMGAAERHHLLLELNDTRTPYPRESNLAGLFQAVARRAPDVVALASPADGMRPDGRTAHLTYGELARRSRHFARRLRREGVGPDVLAGLCLERSAEMIVATLAVVEAGGAYLPLDPSYPPERLALMLRDARATVVVTREPPDVEPPAGTRAIRLDALARDTAEGGPAPAVRPAAGEALAYAMYTSGSTGRPKGVAVPQRAVARLVRETGFADLGPRQTFLQLAPASFDAATLEIWGPLLNGGRLVIAPPGRLALEDVGALIERERVTTVWLTAGLYHQMAESHLGRLGSLRQLLAGGDVLSPVRVRETLERLDCTVINGYGPTENTTFSSCHPMTDPGRVGATVSIGRPIANSRIVLLDPALRPVPFGVSGQLCAAGDGLARGYLGRPAATAEKWVPDPAAGSPGERLYLTGDLARVLRDGTIEFQGRFDHQMKVRGFRIEPGEIEAMLSRQPEVETACVVLREAASGDGRLIAYAATSGSGGDPGEGLAGELLERLCAELPDYMVPARIVFLDALPLNANGKVDRDALPDPGQRRGAAGHVAPRTPDEELVAEVWSEVLGAGAGPVGAEDDFFELGGHSLLATRAVSRLRERTGVEVPLRWLFESPTVAAVAAALGEARGACPPADAGETEIPPCPRDRALPLSFAQERLWILDRFEPANPAYNMPFALRLRGGLRAAALEACLAELARRHEGLRTTFREAGGRPEQRIAPPSAARLPMPRVDLRRLAGADRRRELERRTRGEALRPFDLARGPLARVVLLRLAGDEHVLSWNVHHAVCDGWSLGILTRELGVLYEAAIRGGSDPPASPLPALEIQYADFAVWQRRLLSGEVLARQLAYWREQLRDLPPGLELPTDRPRPAVRSFRGSRDGRVLPRRLSRRLEDLARRRDATLFMVLLAAFKVLLSRLAGEADVAVGIPVAGRRHSQTEDLVGIFLNTLVLRADLGGDPTFEELLARVREVALAAYAHQDLPFEKLLDELQPERDLSRTPLFQVFFNMVNLPFEPMVLEGLAIEPLALPELPSKFDLTLYVRQEEGRIHLELVYNADLFDAARIAELLRQFEGLLTQAAGAPAAPLAELSLRTPEAAAVLPDPGIELNRAWHGAVHELVRRRAEERPDQPAVIDPAGEWTYRELAEQSHRLAHALLSAGIERGRPVAIYAHRSATLTWSVLGVLEAGAAFVLLDPTYPGARLAAIVREARPRAWLQLRDAGPPAAELEAALAALPGLFRLELPPWQEVLDGGPLAAHPPSPAGVEVDPDDLASLSFTSGSTGVPKGIAGRHGPLTHFLQWQSRRFGLDGSDRYSLLSGLAHDPLQRDLFTPLCLGATLCIPDPREVFAAGYLASWMRRSGITVAHLTPAMAQVVTEAPGDRPPEPVESLRYAFLTGDVLTRRDVERLRRLAPEVHCVNFYGATETQRAVGYHVAEVRGGPGRQVLPLGRGVEDVQLLVVGGARHFSDGGRGSGARHLSGGHLSGARHLSGNLSGGGARHLCGIGELGEIWVRSPHLARGYLRDDNLTRERFRPNPWRSGAPDDRVYRTGDLGRYLPGGEVAFAGRADQQVKVRGYRVEPGEIQAQLDRLPGVREAVVLADGAPDADVRLTACVVPEEAPSANGDRPATVTAAGLRDGLRRLLPAYMVPSRFVILERMPLTPNGKIDRRALASAVATARPGDLPAAADQEIAMSTESPRTDMERTLAAILCGVLDVERVGVDDNFFDLGANSLLLVQVHSRLQESLGREIHAVEIFNNPTVARLATYLEGSGSGAPRDAPVEDRGLRMKTGRARLRRHRARRRASR